MIIKLIINFYAEVFPIDITAKIQFNIINNHSPKSQKALKDAYNHQGDKAYNKHLNFALDSSDNCLNDTINLFIDDDYIGDVPSDNISQILLLTDSLTSLENLEEARMFCFIENEDDEFEEDYEDIFDDDSFEYDYDDFETEYNLKPRRRKNRKYKPIYSGIITLTFKK